MASKKLMKASLIKPRKGAGFRHLPSLLTPWLWKLHGHKLLHKSGSVVVFHGPHAERSARQCLRELRRIKRPAKGKSPAGLDKL